MSDIVKYIIIGVIIIAVILLIIFNIRIVPQENAYIIEVLGKYSKTWLAGLHVKIPFIAKIANKVDLREQVLDTPPQPVITKDNVSIHIDAIVYYHVFDPKMYTYGAQDPVYAMGNLSATTLRNIIGSMTLDGALTSRDEINAQLTILMDEATDRWGIKVTRVELRNINPPEEVQLAMEKEMRAEREKRKTILDAEAHKESVIKRAQGDKEAMVLQAEGERDARIARAEGEAKAVQLAKEAEAAGLKALNAAMPSKETLMVKQYEALIALANGQAAKIIIPTDVTEMITKNVLFSETTEIGNYTRQGEKPKPEKKADPCCTPDMQHNPGDSCQHESRFFE